MSKARDSSSMNPDPDPDPEYVSIDRRIATNPEFVGGGTDNFVDPSTVVTREVTDDE